jgi:hypothetical protein
MTTGDILLIIIMFSGSIVFCCVTKYMCCSEEDFMPRHAEPLQYKDATGVVSNVVVVQEI